MIKGFKRKFIAALALALAWSGLAWAAPTTIDWALKRRIGQAEFYVSEFEKEVALQRGGQKAVWRNKKDALDRVQELKIQYPHNADIEKLFQRTKTALMKSKGDYMAIEPSMVQYLVTEENLRKEIATIAKTQWDKMVAQCGDKLITKLYPTPDWKTVSEEDLAGQYVVLDDVQYPLNQFYGAAGEFIHVGKPSSGYYFVKLDSRDWLGPYEAVKRFRRAVDITLQEVEKWTVLGKITAIACEIPQAGEQKIGAPQMGWVVTPVALYVPDHVLAWYDGNHQSSGVYAGEDVVARRKESWYTVKSIPKNVTPKRLMEIFVTAIKEKNYDLYCACLQEDFFKANGAETARYHWDLHQERFHGEYVHVTFSEPKITIIKGFNTEDDSENFFLDEAERAKMMKVGGEVTQEAVIETQAWNRNGNVVGSPKPHRLRKVGNGRWYVYDFAPRF